MRIMITGIDGYLGWPLTQHLASLGHDIAGVDNMLRRKLVGEMGSLSAIPVEPMAIRLQAFYDHFGDKLRFYQGDITDYSFTYEVIREFKPEAIVHLGEIPSAPYSMINVHKSNETMINNIVGTQNLLFCMRDIVPDAHLVKLGTMGEYGTPNMPIPEGFFEMEYKGHKEVMPFPRTPGSWYHLSKVHDTQNIMFACRIWGLRSTDIMQGVVYGTRTDTFKNDPRLRTRLDFDEAFGTAINRFACQAAIGMALTPYGKGLQKRGFLPIRDSMQCLTIAINNPPKPGEYRVFNQFEEVYSISDLALKVKEVGDEMGLNVRINRIENPRIEKEDHFYEAEHQHLLNLGYKPTHDMKKELRFMLEDLAPNKGRISSRSHSLMPSIRWSGKRDKCQPL